MANNKSYQFERNRYYYGKLLTTSDLEAEQNYINGKRQFINQIMFGSGKICGLKVYHVNDDALMLESGFAIDNQGREIVVDKSEIKKIASIEGFDDIKSDLMVLSIKYDETLSQPVYSVTQNSDSKEFEYNKINENYKLQLREYVKQNKELILDESFISNREIYSDDHYKISIKMPTEASTQCDLKLEIVIERLTEIKEPINLKFVVNIPGFLGDNNGERLVVDLSDVVLDKPRFIKEYWITPTNVLAQDNIAFMIKKDDVNLKIGKQKLAIDENIVLQLDVKNEDPIEIVKTKVKNESLESVLDRQTNGEIILACIKVDKIGNSCVIKDVKIPIESKYSTQMPSQTPYIDKIMEYYYHESQNVESQAPVSVGPAENNNFDNDFRKRMNNIISSGVFEMPLGLNVKANKTIFSDEIMHNLGPGNVCVNVGFEFVMTDQHQKGTYVKKIISGDPEIFKDEGVTLPSVSSAVEVFCEKGTFVVGLKFAQATNVVSVKIRWFAYKQLELSFNNSDIKGGTKGIYVKQDTIKLIPNEIHFIEVGFNNMNPTALRYEVIDKDGGEIDENGCYTAPNKDGVYEIKISCINEPSIYTFAYAIVMKKEVEKK